eukprot:SAG22_NODE_3306_length_1789_cov_5.617751_3_plen_84_part_00
MHLFVKTIAGETLKIECEGGTTIEQFKQTIQQQEGMEGIPPDRMRLIYAGKQLEPNDRSIADCHCMKGSTFYLVLREDGGQAS